MKRFQKPLILIPFLLLLGLGIWAGLWAAKTIPQGVSVGGLDMGGLSRWEAHGVLREALEEKLYGRALEVQLPEETLTLTPEESGVNVQIWRMLQDAGSGKREIALLPYLDVKEEAVQQKLTEYAARWDTELSQPKWELMGTRPELSTDGYDPDAAGQTLHITRGIPKQKLDVSQVYGEILAAYNKALTLEVFSVTPEVQPEAFPDTLDLDAIYQEICTAPVDDSLNLQTYSFVPGSYGYHFDMEAAHQALEGADWGQTLSIPMVALEPEILGEAVYFRDVLGSCETRHTDDENRNTNLRLLCRTLGGMVLQPGEEFSYNGALGERTEEKGYKPANAYSGNRLVKDIGGGVCQGSTTLYNCALLADLEILERVCHGVKVGYVPLGLDAAVNWATKTDLRFRNNFHFPIMIQAEVSEGYVKMKLLGTDEKDYTIEMRCGVGEEGTATYAVSYKCKYSKETGELLSKDVEARSAYYTLS